MNGMMKPGVIAWITAPRRRLVMFMPARCQMRAS